MIGSSRRSIVSIAFAVFVLAALGSGAGTYALWSDSESTSPETIRLDKSNQQTVTFKNNCKRADVRVDDPSNYEFTAVADNGATRTYDDPNEVKGNDKVKVKARNIGSNTNRIAAIRMDGTKYRC